jgi:hypothetical protein
MYLPEGLEDTPFKILFLCIFGNILIFLRKNKEVSVTEEILYSITADSRQGSLAK